MDKTIEELVKANTVLIQSNKILIENNKELMSRIEWLEKQLNLSMIIPHGEA